MKRFMLFVYLLLHSVMMHSQARKISFTGYVRPEHRNWPVKALRHAQILVIEREHDTVGQQFTDDSGFFKMDISLQPGNSPIQAFVSARNGQRVITIDSICPYNVLRTPHGYYDYWEQLLLSDTQTILSRSYRLQGGTHHPWPHAITFKEQSLEIVNDERLQADTVLQCLRNSHSRIPDNLRIKLNMEVYAGDNGAFRLAKRRMKKIAHILVHDYGIPGSSIEIHCESVKARNPGSEDKLRLTLVYVN
jgi:hypothetical protein